MNDQEKFNKQMKELEEDPVINEVCIELTKIIREHPFKVIWLSTVSIIQDTARIIYHYIKKIFKRRNR